MGGRRQARDQKETSEARRLTKPTRVTLETLAVDFLALSTAVGLCRLLNATVEDLITVCTPDYSVFEVVKKGKMRTICSPNLALRQVQRTLLTYLNAIYVTRFSHNNPSAQAFITSTQPDAAPSPSIGRLPERNIVSNASSHIGKGLVVHIDIENFFSSVSEGHVRTLFRRDPFNFPEELISLLWQMVSYEGVLPVGAPTSPVLSNLVLQELDQQFRAIEYVTFTRYADDFTFSTDHYSASTVQPLVDSIISAIEATGFRVNKEKLSIAKSTQRQAVTGIIVNRKLNVSSTYVRNIRAILHSIAKGGWQEASWRYAHKHESKYLSSVRRYFYTTGQYRLSDEVLLNHCGSGAIWFFCKSLRGRIEHVGYVKGKTDEVYNKLKNQFLALANREAAVGKVVPNLASSSTELAYITNATANSVVYYAYTFLKNSGYTNTRVAELRNAFSVKAELDLKAMLRSFEKESAYFLNLYAYMLEENKFAAFSTQLSTAKFKQLFKFNNNASSLIEDFDRRIFHTTPECGAARNDYDDGIRHEANTGIFFDRAADSKVVYILRRPFLQKLGMRACHNCEQASNTSSLRTSAQSLS